MGIYLSTVLQYCDHQSRKSAEVTIIVLELAENSESEGRVVSRVPVDEGGEKTGAGPGAAGELKEYIIVDEEDVSHTTVEMYTSGIYTQVSLPYSHTYGEQTGLVESIH